ncbi:hypothetical protein GCM10011512_03970 [Tersicoccus solisilvae]|uniref:Aminobenzoate synthetase n=1 Tax=Tersicoccus solisilvae TaxID=1882339 RepID=A0ABQ1NUL6_9MICC|nr:hypothetical protein [Tersicoccus solisilvae]GGC80419.1 hypothetical protein GCM10011512_03970 [Tersicoccus solisilvae]
MSTAPRTQVIGVDGRSGAGKTTLAAGLARALGTAGRDGPQGGPGAVRVFHLEDLYPGWDGLAAGMEAYRREVLEPLAAGRAARWTAWDWEAGAPGAIRRIEPGGLVIAEGVGAGHAAARPALDALVWLDLPADRRRQRALDRDGAVFRPHWSRWATQERAWLAHDDVAAAADVVVTGEPDPAVLAQRIRELLGTDEP